MLRRELVLLHELSGKASLVRVPLSFKKAGEQPGEPDKNETQKVQCLCGFG
jgi:hypothetical protein